MAIKSAFINLRIASTSYLERLPILGISGIGPLSTIFLTVSFKELCMYGSNPNRVYFMGYSAGGDGVYQLAPRMADRLAAASMMAGHPNDASPLGLRNIGFAIHVGALDSGYNRNKVAAKWSEQLATLQKRDPEGYLHAVKIHKGLGHWMKLEILSHSVDE